MGGSGSGTWYRWDKKTYTEEVKRIDIHFMKKQNLTKPHIAGSLSWNCGGEPSGDIRFKMYPDKMILLYKFRESGGDWESVEDTVMLDETPCHYGGSRKWFICPSCARRVGLLYGPGKYFRCRHCYGLSYSSQSEGYLDRMARKAKKIRRKLDIGVEWWEADCLSDPIFEKPKGMRWRTFERLKRAENHAQSEIERVFVSRYGQGWY